MSDSYGGYPVIGSLTVYEKPCTRTRILTFAMLFPGIRERSHCLEAIDRKELAGQRQEMTDMPHWN